MHNSNDSILFLGDVFLDKKYDLHQPIAGVPFVFNLEYPIIENGKPIANKICLKAKENFIINSFSSKPLAVCLANNHIFDYGIEGFQSTVSCLNKSSIPYFGAGIKENNWNNPAMVLLDKKKVFLLGYCDQRTIEGFSGKEQYRPAPLDFDLIKRDINLHKNKDVSVVVNIHWGIVQVSLPRPDCLEIARKIIDAGADVIIGHHSHVIQPIEVYRGKLIAYGLGDFLFPDIDLYKYDTDGKPCHRMARNFNKSRRSLGVLWDINTKNFELIKFQFDGEKVIKLKEDNHKLVKNRLIACNQTYSEAFFQRHLKILRWKRKFQRVYRKHILNLEC